MSARDGRLGIAFDGNELVVFVEDELSATHAAVRADGARDVSVVVLGNEIPGSIAHRLRAGAVAAFSHLPVDRPTREQVFEHGRSRSAIREAEPMRAKSQPS